MLVYVPTHLKGNILHVSQESINEITYSITNMLGQVVLKGYLNNYNKINTKTLESGVYLIPFNTNNQRVIKKLLKK